MATTKSTSKRTAAKKAAPKKKAAVKKAAKKAATKPAKGAAAKKAPGIGRSAISGRYMSVSAAKSHSKTAIVEGAGGRKRK